MSAILGFRPLVEPGELIVNYLMRLAYGAGIGHISEFLRLIEMDNFKYQRFLDWNPKQLANLESVLTRVCGRDMKAELSNARLLNDIDWLVDRNRTVKRSIVDFPRICPDCMAEKNSLDWRWQIDTVARCYQHKRTLLDTCPKCDNSFTWHSGLLVGCPHCHSKWGDMPTCQYANVRRYGIEQTTWPDISGDIKDKGDLNLIQVAILAMARPFDIVFPEVNQLPYSKNHSELVLSAMAMLHRKTFPSWHQAIDINRTPCLPNEASPVEVYLRQNGAPSLEKNGRTLPKYPIIERIEYLISSRTDQSLTITEQSHNARYHVARFELAKAMGIELQDLDALTANDVIKPIFQTNILERQLFSTHTVSKIIEKQFSCLEIKDPVFLTRKRHNKTISSITFSDVLIAIAQNVVQGRAVNVGQLSEIEVNRHEYKALCALGPQQRRAEYVQKLAAFYVEAEAIQT